MRRTLALLAVSMAAAAPTDSRWRIIGPGGGGSMFHPTISPHDWRTVLIASDMTGNYITHDAGETWRNFNLRGPVSFFAFDPTDPKVLYANSVGLFRSADGGTTWKMLLPSPASIVKVTNGDDHAEETLHVRGEPRGEITAMAIDPADSRSLYVAVGPGLWGTNDVGATWKKVGDFAGRVSGIWIDSRSARGDRSLYVAGPDAIHVRRAGKWIAGDAPGKLRMVSASLPAFYAISGEHLFFSDTGEKWRALGDIASGVQPTFIAVSPQNASVAYASFVGKREGMARTTDRGRTWEILRYSGRDAWLNDRFGAGWAGNPHGIAVAPGDGHVAYATDYGRVMRTEDGGETWLQAYAKRASDGNWTTNGIDVTTCYGVHFDPFDPRHMFISYTDIGLFASDNGGTSWYSATRNGVPKEWSNTTYWVEFDPTTRGRIWAAMSGAHDLPRTKMFWRKPTDPFRGGVARSDDGGRTWRLQNNGMPEMAATHILRDAASGALYVTGFGRGVYKSVDGGDHWQLKNVGFEGDRPFAWRLASDGKGTLYVVLVHKNGASGALYRSKDGAEHWNRVTLPAGVDAPNGITVDPSDASRLYLAVWGSEAPEGALHGGIWASNNAGASWRNMLAKDQHIYDVTVDPRSPRVLYATGFESSLWRSADRGMNWKRIEGYDFKWGHRAIVDPVNAGRIYVTTFGGSVWWGPAQ